jgi:hypothetical protein
VPGSAGQATSERLRGERVTAQAREERIGGFVPTDGYVQAVLRRGDPLVDACLMRIVQSELSLAAVTAGAAGAGGADGR